jgi:hypothetical protein
VVGGAEESVVDGGGQTVWLKLPKVPPLSRHHRGAAIRRAAPCIHALEEDTMEVLRTGSLLAWALVLYGQST